MMALAGSGLLLPAKERSVASSRYDFLPQGTVVKAREVCLEPQY